MAHRRGGLDTTSACRIFAALPVLLLASWPLVGCTRVLSGYVASSTNDAAPVDAAVAIFTVTVAGTANIYGAGQPQPPAVGGGTTGTLPTLVALPAESRVIRLNNASGKVRFSPVGVANGADGVALPGTLPPSSFGGLAGLKVSRARALVGVFLDAAAPADPPPDPFESGDGTRAEYAPGLRQIFFVGDGLTLEGAGSQQTFVVPMGATRLYLGLVDSGLDLKAPRGYDDNSGELSVTLRVTFGP